MVGSSLALLAKIEKIAIATKNKRITSPARPILFVRNCAQKRTSALRRRAHLIRPGDSFFGRGGGATSVTGATVSVFMSRSPHARVEVPVGKVGDQVRHDHADRREQEGGLEDREV